MKIIAFDSHKRYSQADVEDKNGNRLSEQKIYHRRDNIRDFLTSWDEGSPVAVESIGSWYWLVDARKAKMMLRSVNKTDKACPERKPNGLDARGLNKLQRAGTLPTVWIPPGELRDKRELPRTRMVFARIRTRLKNRIHSIFDKYGYQDDFCELSDIFGKQGRSIMKKCLEQLPPQTAYTTRCLLDQLDMVVGQIGKIEQRMREVFEQTKQVQLLDTWLCHKWPGVGFILAVVISQEIGDICRFGSPQRLASYAGTVPRVHSSGGETRYGRLREDVNHYLKWAYCEAASTIASHHKRNRSGHLDRLYARVRARRGHSKAVGAVARHLAEASWSVLTKQVYHQPKKAEVSLTGA